MGAGKYAVWFEARDEGGTVARSMDLGSGKITDTIDRQTSIGGLWAGVAVDPRDDTRLCLTNAGKTWASTTCSWKLVGSRVVRSAALPRPTPTGKAVEWGKRLGVRDDELASALGPDGRIVVLATCEPSPRPDDVAGSHLRLRSFDVQSHRPLDSVLLREAAFPFAWLTMGMGMGTPPSLVFVAPRRVLFTAGQPSVLQTAVYDLDAKTLVPIAGTEVALTDSPSVLALGSGKIFDTRAMKALELTADEAAFRAAHTLPPVCDGK
jgi:hypothetical protein